MDSCSLAGDLEGLCLSPWDPPQASPHMPRPMCRPPRKTPQAPHLLTPIAACPKTPQTCLTGRSRHSAGGGAVAEG